MKQITFDYIDNEKIYSEFKSVLGNTPDITDTTSFEMSRYGAGIIKFNIFKELDFVMQGFSTRLGGVSEGIYKSMNLTFGLNDLEENVYKNFNIIAEAMNTDVHKMVYSKQTHTTNVLAVNNSNSGMGIVRERNFDNIDALVTDVSQLCLVTSYADCIPVIVVDTKNKCIGAAHSGWRGTVGDITHNMLKVMKTEYKTSPKDIKAFVGPGICPDCYEVSTEVAEKFRKKYDKVLKPGVTAGDLIVKNGVTEDKFQLNLPMANVFNLYNCGVSMENISVSDICTCCNSDLLFSHRATGGKRGLMCNFIYLK